MKLRYLPMFALAFLACTPAKSDDVLRIREWSYYLHVAKPIVSGPWYDPATWFGGSYNIGDKCRAGDGVGLRRITTRDDVVIAEVQHGRRHGCPEKALVYLGESEWKKLEQKDAAARKTEAEQKMVEEKAKEIIAEMERK